MKEVFELKEHSYSLRSKEITLFAEILKLPITVIYYSIKYLASKIWDLVSNQIKHCGSLTKFKNFIKLWSPSKCPCRLFKHIFHKQDSFDQT